jgi:hypothetical protein
MDADPPAEPVLIVGTRKIAAALGLSMTMTKRFVLGKPGFPAWRLKPRGQWITTRENLERWAKSRPEMWAGQRDKRRKWE